MGQKNESLPAAAGNRPPCARELCTCCGVRSSTENGHCSPLTGGFYCPSCCPAHHGPNGEASCDGCWPSRALRRLQGSRLRTAAGKDKK